MAKKRTSNRKRTARAKFAAAFSGLTVDVILDVARGRVPGVPTPNTAAYKANLTRGTYAPFARLNASGRVVGTAV